MGIRWARVVGAVVLITGATVGVSGCTFTSGSASDGGGSGTSQNGGSGGQGGSENGTSQGGSDSDGGAQGGVVAPVIVSLDSIDGTTVEVPVDNVVVLESGDTKVTVWTASVADPKVAQFVPGRDDGSATFNPGIQPLAAGETTVTVTNSDTGNESTFELDVTP